MNRDISVVIVNYRTSSLLPRLLTTLRGELEGIDSEVVVVDNSCSRSERAQLKKLRCEYPWVKFVINRFNLGYAGACHVGLEHTSGRYVLFMNPDVLPCKGSVKTLLEHAANRGAAAAVPKLFLDEELQVLHPPAYPFKISTLLFHRLLGRLFFKWWSSYSFKLWGATEDTPIKFIVGAAFLVAREEAEFDMDLPLYFEDAAFSLVLERKNKLVLYCPHSVMVHLYDMAPSKYKNHFWKISEDIYFRKYFGRCSLNLLKALNRFSSSWTHGRAQKLQDILKNGEKVVAVSPHSDFVPFALASVSSSSHFAKRFKNAYAFCFHSHENVKRIFLNFGCANKSEV